MGETIDVGSAGQQAAAGVDDLPRPPARVLAPREVYVKGYKVNPPQWCRWVGWLEKDLASEARLSHKTALRVSA